MASQLDTRIRWHDRSVLVCVLVLLSLAASGGASATVSRSPVLQVGVVYPWGKLAHKHMNWLLAGLMADVHHPINVTFDVHPIREWRHNNSLLVSFSSLTPFFSHLHQEHLLPDLRIGALHLGDSDCTSDIEFYEHAAFVYRNYWCDDVFDLYPDSSFFLPLGWHHTPPLMQRLDATSSGSNSSSDSPPPRSSSPPFGTLLPAVMRQQRYSFLGSFTHFRNAFFTLARANSNFNATSWHVKHQVGAHSRKPSSYYYQDLRSSAIALCPASHEDGLSETSRIYEALVSGAIPVVCMCPTDEGRDL